MPSKKYDPLQDPEALLRTGEAAAMLGMSAYTVRRWRARGYGPKYIALTPNRGGYRRRDLLAWIAEREAAA